LITCYTEALPFLERTVLGDLFYTAVLTVAYLFLTRHFGIETDQQRARSPIN
jgi:hypothetical protein